MAGYARAMVGGKIFPEQKMPQLVRFPEMPFTATPSIKEACTQPGNGDDLKGNVGFEDFDFLRLDCLCGFLHYCSKGRRVSVHV